VHISPILFEVRVHPRKRTFHAEHTNEKSGHCEQAFARNVSPLTRRARVFFDAASLGSHLDIRLLSFFGVASRHSTFSDGQVVPGITSTLDNFAAA
jgi:hypothetical protein